MATSALRCHQTPQPAGHGTHLVGTGTSVTPPSMVAWSSRTKATNGFSRNSTSPTSTLEASASLGIFLMNLFFSCRERQDQGRERWPKFGFSPFFFHKVEAPGSEISPLVVPGLPEVGTEEPHPGIRQGKFTKLDFFRNLAKTETGSKVPPQDSATQPAMSGFALLGSPQGKLPEIPLWKSWARPQGCWSEPGMFLEFICSPKALLGTGPASNPARGRFLCLVPPQPRSRSRNK